MNGYQRQKTLDMAEAVKQNGNDWLANWLEDQVRQDEDLQAEVYAMMQADNTRKQFKKNNEAEQLGTSLEIFCGFGS